MQHVATRIVEGMTVHVDRMRENIELTHGALFSQRALTALVESGMSRDDAYRLVQESAQRAWDEGIDFRELIAASAPQLPLDQVFDYDAYLRYVPEVMARLDRLAP
jgi:adenylosuccinate lyase